MQLPQRLPSIGPVVRTRVLAVLAAASLAAAGYLLLAARDARRVDRAADLAAKGRYAQAAELAGRVHAKPAGAQALVIRARALDAAGRPLAALQAYRQAVQRTPDDWQLRRDWAIVLLATGQRKAAQAQMTRARDLNPKLELPPGFSD